MNTRVVLPSLSCVGMAASSTTSERVRAGSQRDSEIFIFVFLTNLKTTLNLAARVDHDLRRGRAGLRADALDGLDNVHALRDASKHDMLAVKPVGLDGAEEELRAVGVRASVGHGQG